MSSFLDYFIDPVLRGPTWGCMFTCLSISLMGVIVYLRKESLIGESLSHAAYPGIILGLCLASAIGYAQLNDIEIRLMVIAGASLAALLGYASIHVLTNTLKVKSDSALCFVLSSFFGLGIAFSGLLQSFHTPLFKEVPIYLFGQAATITDADALVYAIIAGLNVLFISLFAKEIQLLTFDRGFAKAQNLQYKILNTLVFTVVTLNIVMGMRSIGVVLISAMLIAPAVASRQFVKSLNAMFLASAALGMASGLLGLIASVELSYLFTSSAHFSLPTGPVIVLVASTAAILSLFFAPARGSMKKNCRNKPQK